MIKNLDVLKETRLIEKEIIRHRRYLHQNAESGFCLPKTIDYVVNQLKKIGCKPSLCGKGGVTCVIGKDRGECVLLRADMDALPMVEETSLSYKSTNNACHACGHDMHTSMLLGCAEILKKYEENLALPVKLAFQGAEEQLLGAMDMIKNGVLEAPMVKSAGMIHVLTGTEFETGTAILSDSEISSPCADMFEVEIIGKGTHGAMARDGIDPINVLAHIALALQGITSREVGLNENALITVGEIRGGSAPNIIPNACILRGSVRSYSRELQDYIKERIFNVCKNTAEAFKAKATVDFLGYAPALKNNGELIKKAEKRFKEIGINVRSFTGAKSTGSEDFAHISKQVPSVMVGLSAGNIDNGYKFPLHHPSVEFDESALIYGTAVYVALGTEILQ